MHLGAALLDRRDAVGIDDGVCDGAILDDSPVDEDVLRATGWTLLGERRDVADDLDLPAVSLHVHQVAPLSVQLIEPFAKRRHRRTLDDLASGARQREPYLRVAQCQLRDQAGDLRRLCAVRFQKFPAGRQVVEEIRHLDRGALGHADLGDRRHRAAIDTHLGP